MKRILMILCVLGAMTAKAQYTQSVPNIEFGKWGSVTLPYYTSGDDTATDTDVIRAGIIMNGKYDVQLKVVSTKVSGTMGGSLYVRVSPDGTNWFSACQGTQTYNDSATIANATTTYLFSLPADQVNAKYIEMYYSQSGTCVSAPVATLYYRKPE